MPHLRTTTTPTKLAAIARSGGHRHPHHPQPPHSPQVREALHELMRGATGEALEASAGGGAPLFELAALVSAPGARAQPMHADTLWCEGGCLFTAFVALQPVRCEMGPAHLPTRPLSTNDPTHTHSRILRPNHS